MPLEERAYTVSKESGNIGKIFNLFIILFRFMTGAMVFNLEAHCLQSWTLKGVASASYLEM